MILFNNCYMTVSGHFFGICMLILHKPKVQMIILVCSTGLNFNRFTSYGMKCSLMPGATLANSQKIVTDFYVVTFRCQMLYVVQGPVCLFQTDSLLECQEYADWLRMCLSRLLL